MPENTFHTIELIADSAYYAPPSINSFSDLAAIAINTVIGVGFSLSIVALAYSAFMYVTSGGSPENTKKAYDAFLWGFIGGAVILGAVAIKTMIISGFGVGIADIESNTPSF